MKTFLFLHPHMLYFRARAGLCFPSSMVLVIISQTRLGSSRCTESSWIQTAMAFFAFIAMLSSSSVGWLRGGWFSFV